VKTPNLPVPAIKPTLPSPAITAREFTANSRSANTIRAYRSDWSAFTSWCASHRVTPLPATPETVASYLAELARDHKVATITRRLAAIAAAHRLAEVPSPTTHEGVRLVMAGIRRTLGTAPRQVRPILLDDLRAMVGTLGDDLAGVRDRAILLLGFAGAFRRSELVALDVDDLTFSDAGVVVNVRRSRTDQEGAGREVGIPYGTVPVTCPVRALHSWLQVAGITDGPVFRRVDRHGHLGVGRLQPAAVAAVIKRAAQAAGLDPVVFSGHSLRAGLATAAAANGAPEHVIASQTGHKSSAMLRRYIRKATLFQQNAATMAGL
jgi:integrase